MPGNDQKRQIWFVNVEIKKQEFTYQYHFIPYRLLVVEKKERKAIEIQIM